MHPRVPSAVGISFLYLAVTGTASAAEQPPTIPSIASADPFDALQRALRAEREAKARAGGTTGMGSGREMYETRSFLEGIRQALNRGEDNNALSAINQIEAITGSVKRAGEIVLQAKEPKELDRLIADFNRLAEERSSLYSEGRETHLVGKVRGAAAFLSSWQDYLVALTRGDDQSAANTMRNLASNGSNVTLLVPRSEIAARQAVAHKDENETAGDYQRRIAVETNGAVADALDGCHALADIPATLNKLNGIWSKIPGNNASYLDNATDIGSAINNLQALQRAAAEL